MSPIRYSDTGGFRKLWTLEQPPSKVIEVVFDGYPARGVFLDIDLRPYLTPYDWVVSYILRSAGIPLSRIVILNQIGETAQAECTSWFSFEWKNLLISHLAKKLIASGSDSDQEKVVFNEDERHSIRTLWRTKYLQRGSGEHHSAANILGGLIIGGDTSPPNEIPVEIAALRAHLRDLGFVGKDSLPSSVQTPTGPADSVFKKWLLVDDMAKFGWESFVANKLEQSGSAVYHSQPQFSKLLREIKKHLEYDRLDGTEILDSLDIVLLDLYITHGTEAKAWQAQLEQFVREIQGLPNVDKDKKEVLSRVHKKLEHSRKDALFPALMALAFPLLPIVLFSSTERRDVVEALGEFPNIIIDFQKPSLLLAAEGSDAYRKHANAALDRALQKAKKVRALRESVNTLKVLAEQSLKGRDHLSLAGKTVEVYIDESGDPAEPHIIRRLGAMIAVYKNDGAAESFETQIKNIPANCVGYSGGPFQTDQTRPQRYALKREAFRTLLPHAAGLATPAIGVQLWFARFAVCGVCDILALRFPDPTYFGLMRALVESLIYDWMPAADLPANFRIFIGTRVYQQNTIYGQAWEEFAGLHRFQTEANGPKLSIMPTGAAHIVVNPILDAHRYKRMDIIKQITSPQLQYYEQYDTLEINKRLPPVSQLHYLADVVAGGRNDNELSHAGVSSALKVTCTWDELRDGSGSWVSKLRDASRFVDQEQPVKAFLAWHEAQKANPAGNEQWFGYVAERVWGSLGAKLSLATVRQLLEELRI